eukprot:439303_1
MGSIGFTFIPEKASEIRQDLVLGLCFAGLAIAALVRLGLKPPRWWRLCHSRREELDHLRPEPREPVICTFYGLIIFTATVRAIWFFTPDYLLEPSYAPENIYAFHKGPPSVWLGVFVSEVLRTAGSICMFSIFILMIVYWANLLEKVFNDGNQVSSPMLAFWTTVGCLSCLEATNMCLFLLGVYSSQGMMLWDCLILSVVALVCCIEITIHSQRFRALLLTLGAINQVSTDAQVRRILWITISGNIFFIIRATIEITVGYTLFIYWKRHKSFGVIFDSNTWDAIILIKYYSEIFLLILLLSVLQAKPETPSPSNSISSTTASSYGSTFGQKS